MQHKKTVNYGELMDLKNAHFKFWCKEDVATLYRQLRNQSGRTTLKKIDFSPHPSRVRKLNQNLCLSSARNLDNVSFSDCAMLHPN